MEKNDLRSIGMFLRHDVFERMSTLAKLCLQSGCHLAKYNTVKPLAKYMQSNLLQNTIQSNILQNTIQSNAMQSNLRNRTLDDFNTSKNSTGQNSPKYGLPIDGNVKELHNSNPLKVEQNFMVPNTFNFEGFNCIIS